MAGAARGAERRSTTVPSTSSRSPTTSSTSSPRRGFTDPPLVERRQAVADFHYQSCLRPLGSPRGRGRGFMRSTLTALMLLSFAGAAAAAEAYHLIPGAVPLDSGPDGNTIVLDAPKGLIVFDTGRHPEHAQKILDYAKARHRPIAAIVNSHWHLDHTTGNWDLRQAYPHVAVYASGALEGALATFLKDSRADTDQMLADPKTPPAARDQLLRGRAVIDHPERIRPNHIVARSGRMSIAGRPLDVHLAKFAATEGDVWLYDPRTKVAIV